MIIRKRKEWYGARMGECDDCHETQFVVAMDHESPGEFQYCRRCWSKMVKRENLNLRKDAR